MMLKQKLKDRKDEWLHDACIWDTNASRRTSILSMCHTPITHGRTHIRIRTHGETKKFFGRDERSDPTTIGT
jgi:hypothetical protein